MARLKPRYPHVNGNHPLANGLIRAWPFFEGAGTKVRDYAGKQADGAMHASAAWVGSPYGSALSFDGSSQYVTTTPASEITTPTSQPFSFGCVVSIGATGLSGGSFIISNRPGTGADAGILLRVPSGTSTLEAGYWDGASYRSSLSSSQSLNKWLNVIATWDKTTFIIYINGNADSSQNNAGNPAFSAGSTPWVMGGENNGLSTTLFTGAIAGAAIWRRTLSISEIKQLYFDPFAIYRPSARHVVGIATASSIVHRRTLGQRTGSRAA